MPVDGSSLKYAYRIGFSAPLSPAPPSTKKMSCPTYVGPSVDELLADMQEKLNDELDDLEMPGAALVHWLPRLPITREWVTTYHRTRSLACTGQDAERR